MTEPKREHIPALDGLRGLAALGVLLTHYIEISHTPKWRFFYQGFFGIYLFFALSGFLITRILLATKESPGYFRNFYARRALRIFPLYYGVLALHFFVLYPLMPTPATHDQLPYQGWLWTYTLNILLAIKGRFYFSADWMQLTHFWTLAVEEQFYLVWPAIVLLLRRRHLLILCLILAVFSTLFRYGLFWYGANGLAIRWATPCVLDSLALGAAIACLESAGLLRQAARWAKPVMGVLAAVLFVCWLRYPKSPEAMPLLIPYYALMTVFLAGALLLVVTGSFRWLAHPVLREIGQKSYGIYVLHFPLIGLLPLVGWHLPGLRAWFGSREKGDLVYFASMATASYVAAFLSYNLYEKQFLKLKRFFGGRTTIPTAVRWPSRVESSDGPQGEPRFGGSSTAGRIWKEAGIEIRYDVTGVAGNRAASVEPTDRVWMIRRVVRGRPVEIVKAKDDWLYVTIPSHPEDTAAQYFANFYAKVSDEGQIADVLLITLTHPAAL